MKQSLSNIKTTSCLFISLSFVFLQCNNKDDSIHKEYYPNGKLKLSVEYFNNKRNGMSIFYYENGNIQSLEKYVNDTIDGEAFSFFSTGTLKKKTIMKMGIQDGVYYSFYPTGSIKEYRKFINGKKEGYGEDYWEKDGNIKGVYFSRGDTLVYRRLFDTLGYVIKTEGDVPAEPNKKVN